MEPLRKKNEANNGDDRLSNLPDAILHQILELSGFQIFDVVKLGVLSKRWNHLWTTMPYIDIDVKGLRHDPTLAEKFTSFINFVLLRQAQSSLVRFKLIPGVFIHERQIAKWLRVVVDRNVQQLDIEFIQTSFSLPDFIAVNDTLRRLKVTMNEDFMQLPSVVRLSQLTSLELNRVDFTDSDTLQRLFYGCCSLESFRLTDCNLQSFGFLDFSSTHLKELIVCFLDKWSDDPKFEIKVSCPNLILFKYSGHVAMNYILENVSSLETAWIDFLDTININKKAGHVVHSILKQLHNVTNLNCDMFVVSCLSCAIDEWIRCPTSFPKVKFLSVYLATVNFETRVMFHLLNHCPNLEVLTLFSDEFDTEWDDRPWELQCQGIVNWKSHPHLKTIKFVNFRGDEYELDFLRFLFKNAKSLERVDIIPERSEVHRPVPEISIEVIEKVLMFPKASSGIVVTFIDP